MLPVARDVLSRVKGWKFPAGSFFLPPDPPLPDGRWHLADDPRDPRGSNPTKDRRFPAWIDGMPFLHGSYTAENRVRTEALKFAGRIGLELLISLGGGSARGHSQTVTI